MNLKLSHWGRDALVADADKTRRGRRIRSECSRSTSQVFGGLARAVSWSVRARLGDAEPSLGVGRFGVEKDTASNGIFSRRNGLFLYP
jgi:hypothetical protein